MTLVKQEGELLRTELEVRAERLKASLAVGAVATLGGVVTAIMMSFAATYGLARVVAAGWAALIVGVVWATATFITVAVARTRLRASAASSPTAHHIKRDAKSLKEAAT